jgi:hypothetical protein
MTEADLRNSRELRRAALETKDLDELLQIVQQLDNVLKAEESVRRDSRQPINTNKAAGESQC